MHSIFTNNFLSHYLPDFRASSLTDIRGIILRIESLVEELGSGKLEMLKEEEVKSRFINMFFGDVLGFNYGNSNWWQLREEKKSVVDGKKADAALGYFIKDKGNDDVRAVIEIKDAKTDLDTKQNREGNQTAVEQAFSYVPKMGGNCKWVVVSNIKEIRFYCSSDISKYQVYFLKDLLNENIRNELLFLFHKDRLIKKAGKSQTDLLFEKSKAFKGESDLAIHIIDKINNCLKRFKGFRFVDPNYIVTIHPFNILDEHVWHYHNGNLFTINKEIYELLMGVSIEYNEIVFTSKLKEEIEAANVIDAKVKLEDAFIFLNHCQINFISAIKDYKQVKNRNKRTIGFSYKHSFNFKEGEEGISKNIYLLQAKQCDCLSCIYRSLNFNRFLGKLKAGIGNESLNTNEYAFGNYLASSNNFKTTYSIYKTIEKDTKGKEGKEIEYFLTKKNIKYLHNLILDYQYDDRKSILSDIKAVDLDKVIYDEIEFNVDKEVKNYLIDVKEDSLIYKLQDEIEEIIFNIEKLKRLYDNGGIQHAGPNLPKNLYHAYYSLYIHINGNYIVYDSFRRYTSLTEKVFKGLVMSYQTKEVGIKKFDDFFLTEAILHINPNELQETLKGILKLKTDNDCVERLLEKLNSFTTSYFEEGVFDNPYKNSLLEEYMNYFKFRAKFTNIFANLFTILSRLEISNEQFAKVKQPLLKFLKIESELAWFDIKEFGSFLIKKGDLFEAKELLHVLRIAINGDKYGYNKYANLIEETAKAIAIHFPNYEIDNIKLIQLAILNCASDDGENSNCMHIIPLVNICAANCSKLLLNACEIQLDNEFSIYLYEELLEKAGYDYKFKNYFQIYSNTVNTSKGQHIYKYGKLKLTDVIFMRYAYLLYKLDIEFDRNELKSFTNLNHFEAWILSPISFDYDMFKAEWLLDLDNPIFLNRLKGNSKIREAIEKELLISFEPVLARIMYQYFINKN